MRQYAGTKPNGLDYNSIYLQAFSNLKLTPSAIDKSTPIHLYVEDKDHPLKNSGYEFLQVVQSKTFIIPCMPTHPDVIVSLWKQGRRIEAGDQYITFDPKVITYFLFKIWHVQIWLGYAARIKISREIVGAFKMLVWIWFDVSVNLWIQGRHIESDHQYIIFDPKVITYFLFKIWHVQLWLGYTIMNVVESVN